jgi:hypothetical protein
LCRGLPGEVPQLCRSDWYHLHGQETDAVSFPNPNARIVSVSVIR